MGFRYCKNGHPRTYSTQMCRTMSNPLKNPDRDENHRRRREAGQTEDDPDGREVAEKLYGVPQVTQASNPDTDEQDNGE